MASVRDEFLAETDQYLSLYLITYPGIVCPTMYLP